VAARTAGKIKRKIAHHERLCRQAHAMFPTETQEPDDQASWEDVKPILDGELERLPERSRRLLIGHYLQGKTYAQVAAELSLPLGSVGYHLAQARELLRQRLMRLGSILSVGMLSTFLGKAGVEAAVSPLQLVKAHAVAMAFASGAFEAVPLQVAAALPRGILSTLTATQKKLVLVVALCLGLTGAGVATSIAMKGPRDKTSIPERIVPERIAPPEQAKKAMPDSSGLPEGALSWLGTTKIRPFRMVGIHAIAFAPDGKTLATGGMDHIVEASGRVGIGLWETAPGEDLCRLRKPARWLTRGEPGMLVCGLTFSPNGKILASGYKDVNGGHQKIVLWDKTTGKELDRWTWEDEGKGELSFGLAFSPDGKTLAAGGNKSVRLWEPATGKKTKVREGGATAVVFSPDSTILAAADKKTVRLLNSTTGKVIRQFSAGEVRNGYPIRSLAFTPDGKTLLAPGEGRTVRLWETATGKEIRKLEGHGDGVCAIALAPGGAIVASTDGSQTIRLWEMATGQELDTFEGGRAKPVKVRCLTFSPDGKVLAASIYPTPLQEEDPNIVQLWDVAAGKEIGSGHWDTIRAAVYSQDGKTLTTLGSDNTICIWDATTGQQLRVFNGHRSVVATASFSPDGKKLAVAGSDGSAWLWDVVNGQELRKWDIVSAQELRKLKAKNEKYFAAVKFSPDGQSLATGSPAGQVTIWHLDTGKRLTQFQVCEECVTAVAFSPDGTRLVTAGSTNLHRGSVGSIVRMWEMANCKAIPWRKDLDALEFSGTLPIRRIAFSADTRFLFVSSSNVSVLELASGREIARLPLGEATVAPFPDGRMVALICGKEVVLWDPATDKEVARLVGHTDAVQVIAFSPDGKRLVSAGDDCAGLVWDITRWVRPVPEAQAWTKEQFEGLWNDLGSIDAATAYRAAWSLVEAAPQSVAFLRTRVRPVLFPDRERLTTLIFDLDKENLGRREKACAQLAQLGSVAESSLRRDLAKSPSPVWLQQRRAVQVLEWTRTSEALELLKVLAEGEPDAWLTKEAKRAVTAG
jgi:WD40 repeat protein